MSKASRDKGKRGERYFANAFKHVYGGGVRRGWQSRFGGLDEADLEGIPWRAECKVGRRPSIYKAIEQCKEDRAGAEDERPWVVLVKRDFEKPVAIVDLWQFLDMCAALKAANYKFEKKEEAPK